MIKTKRNIQCIWGGTLAGFLLKSDVAATGKLEQTTTKVIGMHAWLDNLNAMLPLAEKLIDRHPNYEIYLYDRAGHGFSSHIPKGFQYSNAQDVLEIRTVIQTLGWDKEKIIIIGHSYGAAMGILYSASYPDEVLCLVLIDTIPRTNITSDMFYKVFASRIDETLEFHNIPSRTLDNDLTFETALELARSTRPGLSHEAAKLLTERLVRPNEDNELYFTRDESVKLSSLMPFTDDLVISAIKAIKAFVLFIGTNHPQWPIDQKPIDVFKEYNPTFEMTLFDAPHHLHMTHVNEVFDRIEQYFDKYLPHSS